jgi:ubiquitin C-terminal hydrolase
VGFKYQLYAVVVHKGDSLMSGHYFCYIRSSPDTWHKLDDPEVINTRFNLFAVDCYCFGSNLLIEYASAYF